MRLPKRVLFVLTSTHQLGNSGLQTGAYLSEITHAYEEFILEGYGVDMISPHGGRVPLDGVSMDDPINATWMNDVGFLGKVESTQTPWQVNAKDYCGIYFAGGHGAMYDLVDDLQLQKLVADIYDNNGIVGAVCHGVAGLLNVKTHDGKYLIQNHEISCFTNEEEVTVGFDQVMPFLLEDRVKERGAYFSSAPRFVGYAVKSGRIVTGQNPASASDVAMGMIELMNTQGRNPEVSLFESGPSV